MGGVERRAYAGSERYSARVVVPVVAGVDPALTPFSYYGWAVIATGY